MLFRQDTLTFAIFTITARRTPLPIVRRKSLFALFQTTCIVSSENQNFSMSSLITFPFVKTNSSACWWHFFAGFFSCSSFVAVIFSEIVKDSWNNHKNLLGVCFHIGQPQNVVITSVNASKMKVPKNWKMSEWRTWRRPLLAAMWPSWTRARPSLWHLWGAVSAIDSPLASSSENFLESLPSHLLDLL